MATLIETFDMTQILQPVQRPEDARQDAIRFGPSLTITKGQAIGIKTSDGLGYPFATGNADGTQNFVGFAMYSFTTDANGNIFYGASAVASARTGPWQVSPLWISGIFAPEDIQTAATPVGEVDTFTPGGTITTGDVNTLTNAGYPGGPRSVSFTVGATTTAAAVSAALIAAWNADPVLSLIATATGTTTVILTSVNTGQALNVTSAVTGVGTLTKATTTAATGRAIGDITAHGRPGAYVGQNGFWHI